MLKRLGGLPHKMPRRAHKPDSTSRRQVEAMAGYGVPEADIAGVLAIDPKTLRKHYRSELDHGHVKANAKVAENLYRKATGDGREAVIAAIFWLKTRAGWKETLVQEHTGKNDPVVVIKRYVVDPPPPSAREILQNRLAETAARIMPTVIEHQP
jgi:hypothetical protein